MSIVIDDQLREQIPHDAVKFPITYFHDELVELPNWAGPLHWHPDFEIATAEHATLDYQVGEHHVVLKAGDSIFVNGNILHGIRQISGNAPDAMPTIVFSGTLIAPDPSSIYKKYINTIAQCDLLPFVVFRNNDSSHTEINCLIKDIYKQMSEQNECYELTVQRNTNRIFEYIHCNFNDLPKVHATRIQISNQIRLQKMLTYIYQNYAEPITLEDIARAAYISRSEAGRCFTKFMGCSPIDALIRYRLQVAHRLLSEGALSLQEICFACGFNSTNYFSRQFKKFYGYAPSEIRIRVNSAFYWRYCYIF